jgi:hypothetical protein
MDKLKQLPTKMLQTGQRVSRKDTDELGTVVEADGHIKIKWDGGETSYFRRGKAANVQSKKSLNE